MEERIVATALRHYKHVLPAHGKPTTREDCKEWTVFAAVVASDSTERCWVVSSATGTKCTAVRPNHWDSSSVLHDSHAEVLARRGLVRVLWKEIENLSSYTTQDLEKRTADIQDSSNRSTSRETTKDMLLERIEDDPPSYSLREGVDLHLYISDSPCGDASIYELDTSSNAEGCEQFTGAKLIRSANLPENYNHLQQITDSQVFRETSTQFHGMLRTKSGRSNLQSTKRSTSMSCSDKLVRWSIFGLQGSQLSRLIPRPIRFRSCVVGKDPRNHDASKQLGALDRSLVRRISGVCVALTESSDEAIVQFGKDISLPSVAVLSSEDSTFGKAAMEKERLRSPETRKRKRGEKGVLFPSCGVSTNWMCLDESIEVTVGARGTRQGKKPRTEDEHRNMESRLSRNQIRLLASRSIEEKSSASYESWKYKLTSSLHRKVREVVFSKGPLTGWIEGKKDREPNQI